MKIVLYKNGEFVSDGYNRKDITLPPDKLAKGLQYYFIHEIKPDNPNLDRYYIKPKEIALTDEKHAKYDHLLKAIKEFELVEYDRAYVISKLNTEVGNHIELNFPVWKQTKYISRFMYLDMLNRDGTATEQQLQEMAYLNDLDNWTIACRSLRDEKENEYLINGVYPDFYEWPKMPEKTF